MYPFYDLEGINQIESGIEGRHVILLLLVKPSDENAEDLLKRINYWHQKSDRYCSIHLMGYSKNFMNRYTDIERVNGPEHEIWEYSDKCFINVCDNLQKRLKNWCYSGEPELIVLQNMDESTQNSLDFRGYNYIDINYGIKQGYIVHFLDLWKGY